MTTTRTCTAIAAKPGHDTKARTSKTGRRRTRRWRPRVSRLLAWLLAAWLGHGGLVLAQVAPGTLPAGAQVMVGRGVLQQAPNLLVVQQNTPRLGLDWQSFNIGSGATVEFRQPDANSVALNRVLGNSGSEIYGQLRANGQVFLTNPNGVLFAPGSKVDVGGLVASTLDLSQQDFAEGRYRFTGTGGSVVNQGSLNASAGGYLALFGNQVINQGDISVAAGSVVLASGRAATVSISGSGLLSAVVTANTLAGRVDNSGSISADGGLVTLTAKSAQDIAASLVNNSGIVRANTLVERAGEIWITGDQVTHSGQIQAAAPAGGDGGRVVVKGDMDRGMLTVHGRFDLSARDGQGGHVETSAAKVAIAPGTQVDSRGALGTGTWVIDPTDFTVATGGAALTTSGIGADTLSTNLGTTSVSLATAAGGSEPGDIHVNADVVWAANTTLTLTASRDINLNANIAASGTSAGLVLVPGASGVFRINSTSTVQPKVTLSGASASLSIAGQSYTLIRTVDALQAINTNDTTRGANYALAGDIDASATSSWNAGAGFDTIGAGGTPGQAAGSFTGRFDGLGNSITGLFINRSDVTYVGLFGRTTGATLRNVNLAGGSVTAARTAGGSVVAGAFAAGPNGNTTLENVTSDLPVSASTPSGLAVAGGLVGSWENSTGAFTGNITGGVASGSVTASGTTVAVGGLVGSVSRGRIVDSRASGNVSVTGTAVGTANAGGLVGSIAQPGTGVTNSQASGNVTTSGASGVGAAGGLVGRFEPTSSGLITGSSASGTVAGNSSAGGLVGIASGTGSIASSSATGNVSTTGSESGASYVGGAVGQYGLSAAPSALSASGNASGGAMTGGVIGWLSSASVALGSGSVIGAAPSSGTRTVTGPRWVGGLIGYSDSTGAMSDLSSTAAVVATGSSGAAGGLIGRSNGAVNSSSSAGSVGAAGNAGGLVGTAAGAGGMSGVTSTASVTGTGAAGSIGGLVGSYTNTGSLTGTPGVTTASGAVQGGSGSSAITGGLVGSFISAGSIVDASTAVTSTVSGGGDTGGLVGDATGTGTSAITGSTARGAVTGANNVGKIGGLVGDFNMAGGWSNVSATGTVSGGNYTGGLAGDYRSAAAITGGSFTGGTVAGGTWVGGLFGSISSAASVSGPSAANPLTVAVTVTSAGHAGGLAGYTGGGVSNVTATGNVTSTSTANFYVGGLIGDANGSAGVTDVSATGTVTAASLTGSVGGLIGFGNAGGITRGTATGNISGGRYTGGLVGYFDAGAANISASNTSGSVSGFGDAGGLVGYATGSGSLASSSATGTVSSSATTAYSVGGVAGYFGLTGGISATTSAGNVSGGAQTGGVIGYYNPTATLSGVSTTATTVTGSTWVGGIVGYVNGPATLSGLTAAANVTATGPNGAAGGLAGRSNGSVTGSSATGNVVGLNDVGGLIGYAQGTGTMSNVSASGTVTSTSTSGAAYAGGLVGRYALTGGLSGTVTATGVVSGGSSAGGFVGYWNSAAAISGLSRGSASVSGRDWIGGIVGYSEAASLSGSTSAADITATNASDGGAGGVAGRTTGNVSSSSATGNITGRYTVGGLVGLAQGTGTMTDATASGNVSGLLGSAWIGGLVGQYNLSGSMSGTISATGVVSGGSSAGGIVGYYNSAAPISSLSRGSASVTGQDWVGGLIGYSASSSITGSSSAANVTSTGTGYAAGGLVGRTAGAMSNSSATGTVTAAGDVGGLVGRAEGTGAFTDVSASGNVSTSLNNGAAGGLIGRASSGAITRGTASGAVSGGDETGGLVGAYSANASITTSEATGSVTGRGSVGGLVGYATGSGGIVDGTARGNVTGTVNSGHVGGLVGDFRKAGGITRGNAYGNVTGGLRTGGLSGYHVSGGSIANSNAFGTVTGSTYTGGLVGDFVSSTNITDSTANGAVVGTGYTGGLVGSFYSAGSVSTSTANGSVTGGDYAGGLLGAWQYSGGVTDSRAIGNVSGGNYVGGLVGYGYSNTGGVNNSSATGNVSGDYMAGGLIGQLGYTAVARGTASGRVTVISDNTVYVGGLVGYMYGSGNASPLTDSTASGPVFVDASYAYAGGLIGQTSSIAITNGNASGSVTLTDSRNLNSGSLFAGGLVGYHSAASTSGISASRATGHVSGGYYSGGLVGYHSGNTNASGISDSSATGNVSAIYYGGGLVGSIRNVGIRNGQASGNVTVSNASGYAGGLAGDASAAYDGASINDSAATGNVSGGNYAGGLIGYFQNQINNVGTAGVTNNRASGNVSNARIAGGLVGGYSGYYYGNAPVDLGIRNGQASGSVSASQSVGGLVGDFDGFGGIRDSSATGAVVGTSGNATHLLGGLAGRFLNRNTTAGAGALTRSYASGNVSLAPGVTMNTSTTVNAGGLVGQVDGTTAAAITLSDSYASGNVTLTSTNGRLAAGGLVGRANTSIDNAYATGAVSATGGNTRVAGGLVAERAGSTVVATDSYWATDTSGQASSIIGSARTLAQLQTAANFNGWDIASSSGSTAVWRIYEGFTAPLLRGFLTPLALTLVDVSKTYDGSTSLGGATVNSSGGPVQFPDRIRVGGSGVAADVGTYALSAANLFSVQNGYDLNLAGTAQLTVNKKTLTLAGLVANKVYDAGTLATLAGTAQPGGLVAGEDLLFQPAGDFGLSFADKNAGTAKTVNLAGSFTWADGALGKVANYTLPTGTSTTADITKAPLSAGTFTATNRVYDGTTTVAVTATPASLSGVLGSDSVTVDLASVTSGTVADKNVGSGKAVTVLGASLTGGDAGNYTLTGIGNATVNITPRTVTVNGITATDRAYNRATNVNLNTSNMSLSGVLGSDQLTPNASSVSASVADKNVGDAKPVTVTGLRLRGLDAGNYTPQQGSVSVNITPFQLTVYAQPTTGTNRTYDGSTAATVQIYNNFTGSTSNLFSGDNVTLSNTGIAYDNKNVAYTSGGAVTSKTITVSGLSLSGTDAGNYNLVNSTATTTGTISPRALPVSGISATNRVYDGTRDVQINVSSATVDTSVVVAGDNVNVVIPTTGNVTGQMADKNAGTGKAVTVPGLTITGTDAGNYTVNSASNGVTVNITRKDLRVAYTANDKVYDGGTTVVTNATSTDIVGSDDITFYSNYYRQVFYGYNPWATFANKNVGSAKTVSSSTESIFGNDANNYNLISPNGAIATASITAKPVTLAFSGVTKVYDGGTDATVTLNRGASGVFGGDAITTTQNAIYTGGAAAKNVGTAKPISVSDITFSGTDAANYTVANTTATTTGTVTAKPVTLSGISAVDRAYDGTTTVQVNATSVGSSGFVAGDLVSVAQPAGGLTAGTVANKNVGTAKPVTVTGLSLTGTDAVNYSIDLAGSGITVNIGRKELTPTYTGIDRVYNGGVTVGVSSTTTGIETGDTVTFSQLAVFSGGGAKNVGTAKPISISAIALGGASAANYSLTATTATATADVTPKAVTADYTGINRVYNGLADTSISVLGSSLQLLAGDLVGFSQAASLSGNGAAGANRAVTVSAITLTGQDALNYSLLNTTASTTATITPRPLGVTGITATSRVYDGTTTVAVNVSGATVDTSSRIAGDDVSVTLPPSGISTGTLADRHVGNAKPVAITGLAISGAQASNYSLIGATGLNVNITPASLTAVYAAANKVYNGNTSAVVTGSSSDIFAVDAGGVSFNATGTFTGTGAKNVGTDKAVAVRDGFLGGAQRDNYVLLNPTGSTTASITPRTVTASYSSGLSKVYDGDVVAPASGNIVNVVSGDAVSLTQSAEFTGAGARNVGNAKAIAVTAIALTGTDASNYMLGNSTASTVGNITPKGITVAGLSNVTASDRVYDGTRTVDVTVPAGVTLVPSSSDIIAGDVVTIEVPSSGVTTGTMANKNVGTGKSVVVDGLSLSGTDGANYRIAGTAGITVSISARPLTASYTGVSRAYDGSTNASVTGSSADVIADDNLSITGTGVFTGPGARNVGSGKAINVQQVQLGGVDGANYSLVNPTGAALGSITPRSVTAVYTSPGKTYDGGTSAPVAASAGFIAGDQVALSETAIFTGSGAKNVGSNKTIQVSGITLGGSDAGNYALTATSASTTGSIRPKPIGINGLTGVSAQDRVYDGSTAVAVDVQSTGTISVNTADIVGSDDVTVTVPSTGTTTGVVADKNVGTGKAVTVTGLALSGPDAANYIINAASGVTVSITPKPLTATYVGLSRVYDGTTAVTVSGSSSDVVGADALVISGSGIFTGSGAKNAGTGKAIDVASASLSGGDAVNYALVNPTGSAFGSITPRGVTASYVGGIRVYDGTTTAPVLGTLGGALAGDVVSLGQTAVFTGAGAKNVGVGKTVAISAVSLLGSDAANYALITFDTATTATITPRPLGVNGLTGVSAQDRVYDGTRAVAVTVTSAGSVSANAADIISGDDVSITAPSGGLSGGLMADKNVGTAKPVVVSGLGLTGADAGNYSIGTAFGVSVNITPKSLTAVYSGGSRVYDGSTAASVTGLSTDVVSGDAVTILGSGIFTGAGARNVGNDKAIDVQSAALSSADASNYRLLNATGTATGSITPRSLTAVYTGINRVYDGSAIAPVSVLGTGLVAGDVVGFAQSAVFSGTGARNAGDNKPIAVTAITLSGADAANYSLTASTASASANVTPRPLNVSGLSGLQTVDRVYDGTRDVQITGTLSVGSATGDVIAGDDVSINLPGGAISTGTMVDKTVGTGKAVAVTGLSLSGADAPNYAITGTAGLTVNIAPRPVTLLGVSAVDRIYDGSTVVAINSASGSISGGLAGDDLQLRNSGVTGSVADKAVGSGRSVNVSGLGLTGADAGNYAVVGGGLTVNITPRPLNATAAAADKIYDGNTSAFVTLADDRIVGDVFSLASASALFSGKDAGTNLSVTVSGLTLSGSDAGNYSLPGSALTTTASIQRRPLTITANSLSKVYGESINLPATAFAAAGLVQGESIGTVTMASAGTPSTAAVGGSPYAITASNAAGGGFNPANYVLGYVDGALTVLPRPLTIAANSVVRFTDQANPVSFGFSTSVGSLVGGDNVASALIAAPAGSVGAAGGSIFELVPSGAVFGAGVASNYAITYGNGLLVVLPKPPRIDDTDGGGSSGNQGFAVQVSQAEVDGALRALSRGASVAAQTGAEPAAAPEPGPQGAEATAAAIAAVLAGDSSRITLPDLQRLPLISFDPVLRRLLSVGAIPRNPPSTPPAP